MYYLDNAATTKPIQPAIDGFLKACNTFGNPSSLHAIGLDAEKLLIDSKQKLAKKLNVDAKNILFTSGGTEANNLAAFGSAHKLAKRGKHIITSEIEHPSVLEAFKKLQEEGFEVDFLPPNSDGVVEVETLSAALREDTTLVSIMHVNNETGIIQPVDKFASVIRKKSPLAIFHVDCVQSFCKLPIDAKAWDVDLLTISAHKIGAFKGTGALYSRIPKLKPIIYGGEQQGEIRPGTENVPGIVAFASACECYDEYKLHDELYATRETLSESFKNEIPNIKINGVAEKASGSVLNVSFVGIKAEILLHALEARGVYVSTGSACSSHKPQTSHVLTAMGLSPKEVTGAVRFSFIEPLTKEQIKEITEIVKKESSAIRH